MKYLDNQVKELMELLEWELVNKQDKKLLLSFIKKKI